MDDLLRYACQAPLWTRGLGISFVEASKPDTAVHCGRVGTVSVRQDVSASLGCCVWDAARVVGYHAGELIPKMADALCSGGDGAVLLVEVGAGTGVAGTAAAAELPRAGVVLTDSPAALRGVKRNIPILARSLDRPIEAHALPWGSRVRAADIGAALGRGHWARLPVLAIAADCTYNLHAVPALVDTLRALLDTNGAALVIVKLRKDALALVALAAWFDVQVASPGGGGAWNGDSTGEISVLRLLAPARPRFALHVAPGPLLRASLLARRGRDAEAGDLLAASVAAPAGRECWDGPVGLPLSALHRALTLLPPSDVLAGAACASRPWLLASAFRLAAA